MRSLERLNHISISSSDAKGSISGKSPTCTLSGRTKLALSGGVWKYRFPSTLRNLRQLLVPRRANHARSIPLPNRFVPLDSHPHTVVLCPKLGRADVADRSSTGEDVGEGDLAARAGDEGLWDGDGGFGRFGGDGGGGGKAT